MKEQPKNGVYTYAPKLTQEMASAFYKRFHEAHEHRGMYESVLAAMNAMDTMRPTSELVLVTRWEKNGDHPNDYRATKIELDGSGEPTASVSPAEQREKDWEGQVVRRYRHPNVDGQTICKNCGKTMHEHGWIEGSLLADKSRRADTCLVVCPGSLVVLSRNGYSQVFPFQLEMDYRRIYTQTDLREFVTAASRSVVSIKLDENDPDPQATLDTFVSELVQTRGSDYPVGTITCDEAMFGAETMLEMLRQLVDATGELVKNVDTFSADLAAASARNVAIKNAAVRGVNQAIEFIENGRFLTDDSPAKQFAEEVVQGLKREVLPLAQAGELR